MEYQKIINLLDNTLNPTCKFNTRNSTKIKFTILMIRSSLCDYRNAYMHRKGTIATPNNGTVAAPDNRNKHNI